METPKGNTKAGGSKKKTRKDEKKAKKKDANKKEKDKKKKAFDPFERIYGLIRLEKFAEAHEAIKFISVPTPSKQADKFNLLGFTARKSGNLQAAGEYYEQALEINPKHIQALEYQGELFCS